MPDAILITDAAFAKAYAHAHNLACRADDEHTDSMVYFVAPVGGGPIKIGRTRNPKERFAYIQRHSPYQIELIACAPGGAEVEGWYHAAFCDARQHGEWFAPTDRLLGECAKLAERWIG